MSFLVLRNPDFASTHKIMPPTKLNKLVQYEISSSAVQANPSHAWVQTAWVHTKKERQSACLAFELISYGVSFFSFVSGNLVDIMCWLVYSVLVF